MKIGLRARYAGLIVGLLSGLLLLMAAAHLNEFRGMIERASQATGEAVRGSLYVQALENGKATVGLLAAVLIDPVHNLDADLVAELIHASAVRPDIRYILVVDSTDFELARHVHDGLDDEVLLTPTADEMAALGRGEILTRQADGLLHVTAPILFGSALIGCVKVGLSLSAMEREALHIQDRISRLAEASEARFLFIYLAIASVLLLIGLLAALVMAHSLVRPITSLARYVRRVGTGSYGAPPPAVSRADELGDLARALQTMAANLEQVARVSRLATLGEMAVGMAHELSQPLNTIRMAAENAQLSRQSETPDRDFELAKLGLIAEQAARMGELIQRMCVVGRSEGGSETIDPRESVCDAVTLLGDRYADEGIALTLDMPPDTVPMAVRGQRNELAQVLINLLSNARDAILSGADPEDVQRGGAAAGRINVAVSESDGHIRLQVKDNGGGIDPDMMGRIFDPFFTTKGTTRGTGLGLSISFGIISAMGGRIAVENFGGGCVFTVTLPVADPVKG